MSSRDSWRVREVMSDNVREDVQIFYAMCNGALLVSLQEWTLRKVIDGRLDGHGPVAHAPKAPGGAQLAVDLGGDPAGGLWTALGWIAETALHEGASHARARARALLVGAPAASDFRALAMAYFGEIPTPPDGGIYTRAKDGISDPSRGTAHAPSWPALPVRGSPVGAVVDAVAGVRTELSFDDEGPGARPDERFQSLRARATITLR